MKYVQPLLWCKDLKWPKRYLGMFFMFYPKFRLEFCLPDRMVVTTLEHEAKLSEKRDEQLLHTLKSKNYFKVKGIFFMIEKSNDLKNS